MRLQPFCFDAQPPIGNVNGVAFLRQFPPAGRGIVALVLAGMLLQHSGAGTGKYKRVPTVIVLLAVMDIRARKNQGQGNSVLIYDNMSLGAQFPPISRVFPCFFPLSREPRQYGCPESATAMLSLSDHHTRAGSAPTSFGIPLAWPSSGNTDASCCPRSTPVEASSTDSQCAERRRSHSRSYADLRRAFLLASSFAWAWVCIP